MDTTDLAKRMKKYEDISRIYLTQRMPLVLRLDGKSFHSYTKGFQKPFDNVLRDAFIYSAEYMVKEIQGAKLAYMQSDEMSILINNYEKFATQSWFDNNLQKIVSVGASLITAYFNKYMSDKTSKTALFDCRAFILPKEEVCNYFIWRQLDAERNSVSSLAQTHFSHKELHKKKSIQMQNMLNDIGIIWPNLPTYQKIGWCVLSDGVDLDIPRFTQDRDYVNKHLEQKEV